jgi:hypothetical protein
MKTTTHSHRDMIPFPGMRPIHLSDIARNGNQGSIQANQIGGWFPVTGLIGGFLKLCFRIIDYPVPNPEAGKIRGEKPALLFPIGEPIVSRIGCGTGKGRGSFLLLHLFREDPDLSWYTAFPDGSGNRYH